MQVQFNQYKSNICQSHIYARRPVSFSGGVSTMQEKLAILLSETKKLYFSNKKADIKDFEHIIRKISPDTTVRHFSEIPAGSNISPRAGAYFSQKTNINPSTNEVNAANKVIYLNLENTDRHQKLKLFGDFVHEATHIAQEEATDRVSTLDFTKIMLHSPNLEITKHNSLIAGVQGFKSIEYNVILPLVEFLRKNSDIPLKVPYADKNILNYAYKNMTKFSISDYIRLITRDIMGKIKSKLPFADEKYVFKYIHKKAGHEKEAYETSLKFLKDVLNIKGDTDLDYRILLYDEFERVFANLLA
jgi:hypothetical protein